MILGIDLGTTNSLVAYYNNNEPQLIYNAMGDYLIPSVVGFLDDASVIVGKSAKERKINHPLKTFSAFKRDMGTKRQYNVGEMVYTPRDLSSLILKTLLNTSKTFLSDTIKDVVISVPAYFNDHQRQDTIDAAKMIGLKVHGLINEPTDAAIGNLLISNYLHMLDTDYSPYYTRNLSRAIHGLYHVLQWNPE